MHKLLMW